MDQKFRTNTQDKSKLNPPNISPRCWTDTGSTTCAQKLHCSAGAAPYQDEDFFGMGTSRYREERRNWDGYSSASVLDQVEELPINLPLYQWMPDSDRALHFDHGEDQVIRPCFSPHYLQSYPLPLLCQMTSTSHHLSLFCFPIYFSCIILSPFTRKIQ